MNTNTTAHLVPIYEGEIAGTSTRVVKARELHEFLAVGKVFASWITERIQQYDFIENQDFIAISQNREIGHGKGKTEYLITLDMAKELSMVERNEKGKQARRYFIDCEKRVSNNALLVALTPPEHVITIMEFYQWRAKLRFEINAAIERADKAIKITMQGYDYLDLIAGKDTPAIQKLIGGSHE